MASLLIGRDGKAVQGWAQSHNSAVAASGGLFVVRHDSSTHEVPIVQMLVAWKEYAQAHNARFESPVGDDGILGPAWTEIGASLRTMLNGELGRLDGGTLDHYILETMEENGVDTSAL